MNRVLPLGHVSITLCSHINAVHVIRNGHFIISITSGPVWPLDHFEKSCKGGVLQFDFILARQISNGKPPIPLGAFALTRIGCASGKGLLATQLPPNERERVPGLCCLLCALQLLAVDCVVGQHSCVPAATFSRPRDQPL